MRLDAHGHSIHRFIERWWPWTADELRLRSPLKKAAALRLRIDALNRAMCTGAYYVESVPDSQQSIWAFVMANGPNRGRTVLMVVADDGTVRTVLPPEVKRPTNRRRSR